MSAITRIDAYTNTAAGPGLGTDGRVYLGLAGREFALDGDGVDFAPGTLHTYVFGDEANVLNSALNDPRSPQLDHTDLDDHRVYLRLSGGTRPWVLERTIVTVTAGANVHVYDNLVIEGLEKKITLGVNSGSWFFLKRA